MNTPKAQSRMFSDWLIFGFRVLSLCPLILTCTLEHSLSVQLEYYAPTLTEEACGGLCRHGVSQKPELVGYRYWHLVFLWKSHKAFAIKH